MNLRELAEAALKLAIANAKAGVVESGGPNMGDQVEFWQKLGGGAARQSWCQYWVHAMFAKAWMQDKGLLTGTTADANRKIILANVGKFNTATHFPRTGSCQLAANAAKKQGRFKPKGFLPLPGDIVFFDFKNEGVTHHVGIFERDEGGMIYTVEGNTSAGEGGSQNNGDGVYRKVRSTRYVYGYAHFAAPGE